MPSTRVRLELTMVQWSNLCFLLGYTETWTREAGLGDKWDSVWTGVKTPETFEVD